MKHIITLTVSIIFIVTALSAVFAGVAVINEGFNVIFDTGYCTYDVHLPDTKETCSFNWNLAKRDLAREAALLVITLPLAYFSFRRLKAIYAS